jgi:outer membrane protein
LFRALTPILADYVEKNSIAVLLDRKNIIIAKKELDITNVILKILDTKVKDIKIK